MSEINLTREQIQRIAEDLRGTTQSLEKVISDELGEEIEDICILSHASLVSIDELVFNCDICGWWCGTDEYSPDEDQTGQVCDECVPGDEE
jgi:hypothetical protein